MLPFVLSPTSSSKDKPASMIHISIIEDNKYMREGWKTFLDYEEDMQVVGSFVSCEQAFVSGIMEETHLVLMDINLPGINGIEGVRYLKEHHPEILCVMATVNDDDTNIFEALKAGAVGYLMKKVSPEELVEAIRTAVAGGSPITPNIARRVVQFFVHKPVIKDDKPSKKLKNEPKLTERELKILNLLAEGHSYAGIGSELFLSVDGIRYYIRNIYQKLEVHSRSEAVSKGISRRLIQFKKKK
jgi:DNA-binding NarL/FixJ family response regulator